MQHGLKIIHAIGSLDTVGGTTSALTAMVGTQRCAGLDVEVMTPVPRGDAPPAIRQLREYGVSVRPLTDAADEILQHASIIHVHGLWDRGLPFAGRAAKRFGACFVVSPHGMATQWALTQRRLKKQFYRRLVLDWSWPADLTMHFTTKWELSRSPLWSRRQRCIVVPLSVDVESIAEASRAGSGYWRQRLGDGPPTLVFVGRVHPGKGVEYLVPAMRHVPPEAGRLAIVGPPTSPFADGLRKQAEALGVADRVFWIGPLHAPELYAAMGDAAALVLPSDHENFGLVAVEAIAAGAPALVSREVAIGAELVESGAADWVSRQPDQLGAELRAFLSDGIQRDGLGAAARRTASRFGPADVGQQWVTVYKSLLAYPEGR